MESTAAAIGTWFTTFYLCRLHSLAVSMIVCKAATAAIDHPRPVAAEETSLLEFHQCCLVPQPCGILEIIPRHAQLGHNGQTHALQPAKQHEIAQYHQ